MPATHYQQVTAVSDALEAAYYCGASLQRAAYEVANVEGFELTDDLWESAHDVLWARIEAARSVLMGRPNPCPPPAPNLAHLPTRIAP